MPNAPTVALYGATGALGREILTVLEERALDLGEVRLYASTYSEGEELLVGPRVVRVKAIPDGPLPPADVAILAMPRAVRDEVFPRIRASARLVIDAIPGGEPSGALAIPLLGGALPDSSHLTSPGDALIPLARALAPLHREAALTRVVATVLEPASGLGQRGMEALSAQTLALYRKGEVGGGGEDEAEEEPSPFAHQLAFNAIPQVGPFDADGHAESEAHLARALPALLGGAFPVAGTCVRAPWFSSHGLAVTVETERPLSADRARALLADAPGVSVEDAPAEALYPMPFTAVGQDEVFVGRIRQTAGGLSLWVCADNLRVGGALNVVDLLAAWLDGRRSNGAL